MNPERFYWAPRWRKRDVRDRSWASLGLACDPAKYDHYRRCAPCTTLPVVVVIVAGMGVFLYFAGVGPAGFIPVEGRSQVGLRPRSTGSRRRNRPTMRPSAASAG